MGRTSNGHPICWILVIGFLISTLPLSTTVIQSSSAELPNHIIINEILVSPNNEEYGGTDWNGDGKFGTYNDMFVELHNPTDSDVNISNWVLDDLKNEGSPSCSIGWDTVIPAGGYMVFYRVNTGLEFDFWSGDTIHISDSSGNLLDSFSFEAQDSDWDTSYARDSEGNWTKISPPTPGIANDEVWPEAEGGPGINHAIGTC